MRPLANLLRGFRTLFRGSAVDREIEEELSSFVQASTEDKLRRGMPADQAARAARVEMGSASAVKQHIRSVGWETRIETLWLDLRLAFRTLLRSPGFTLVAVCSLALGIGANTAIFTLVRQVILENLPVRDPGQLVAFGKSTGGGIMGGIDLGTVGMFTYDFARRLEANPGPFEGVAAFSSFSPKVNVRPPHSTTAVQVPASVVSANFFGVMGASPLLGRTLAPFDADAPDRSAVAVVSYRFWRDSLSSDPAVLGKTVSVNATPFTVIGVMPPAFHGIKQELEPPDLWVPVTMAKAIFLQPGLLDPRSFYFLHMLARRRPQSSPAADQAWLDRQVRAYVRAGEGASPAPARRQEIERITVRLNSAAHGVSEIRDQYEDSLFILTAIVAVILLIACANLAGFLLARAVARQKEYATRLALGSSRGRIVVQGLAEALILASFGGLLGLGVAFNVTRALIAFVARGTANAPFDARPDGAVLLFTLGVSIAAGLLFGLVPALQLGRSGAGPAIRAGSRAPAGGADRSSRRWLKALVVTQLTLSLVLVIGAGLFLRTLQNLQNVDLGFERSHILLADFDARIAGYRVDQAPGLNQSLIERLSAIPGVRYAALADSPPISYGAWMSTLSISGYTPRPKEDMTTVLDRVSGNYFDAAGIPILAGRGLRPSDTASALKVAVVNQAFARHYFPNGDVIGRSVKIDISEPGPWLIVGVARDSKSHGLLRAAPNTVYMPLAQLTNSKGEAGDDSFAQVIILRTSGDARQAIPGLRAAVAGLDPNLPVLHVQTIRDQLEGFMSHETLVSRLTAVFAALALLLAAIGLYAVMSFHVARRTGEIGVRIALGASRGVVHWMILRESLALLCAGFGLGLPIALCSVRLVRSQLYAMSPFDPAVFIAAIAGIALVTLLSAWLPARRAASVDPMTALRSE